MSPLRHWHRLYPRTVVRRKAETGRIPATPEKVHARCAGGWAGREAPEEDVML